MKEIKELGLGLILIQIYFLEMTTSSFIQMQHQVYSLIIRIAKSFQLQQHFQKCLIFKFPHHKAIKEDETKIQMKRHVHRQRFSLRKELQVNILLVGRK